MKQLSLVLLPLIPAGVLAQASRSDSASAPVRDIHYEVTFLRANAQTRVVDVAMTFTTTGTATTPVLLSLPAWTPGAYEISNFARWVTGFNATASGKELVWDKLDYDTWRV
jgi:predicted metalloprotease with PDZ domain